jgi:hypothetical protein
MIHLDQNKNINKNDIIQNIDEVINLMNNQKENIENYLNRILDENSNSLDHLQQIKNLLRFFSDSNQINLQRINDDLKDIYNEVLKFMEK